MPQIQFGRDQLRAIRLANEWLRYGNYNEKPVFTIVGFAGSGKSSVLRQIIFESGVPEYKIAFVCFTGKAANVLRQKGINAVTCHRLIYNTSVGSTGNPIFRKKKNLPGNIELICIDEAGMLPKDIMNDIMSFGVPIIAMGDSGQLAPIFGENQCLQNPDVVLTEVYRQKEGSSVLELATDIRNGVDCFSKKYKKGVKIIGSEQFEISMMKSHDITICSTNATRAGLNAAYRKIMGCTSPLPQEGEHIVCSANNFKDVYDYHGIDVCLVNGLAGRVGSRAYEIDTGTLFFAFLPDGMPGLRIPVYAERSGFMSIYEDIGQRAETIPKSFRTAFINQTERTVNTFEYFYCCTCHKMQGSEAPKIIIYDDCFYNDEQNYRRWLYTAVTRATESVLIVRT